eukprot:57969-Prymnesium_polylepis.1
MMCTPSSTAPATMGHWGQWLLTTREAGNTLATLLDGPHSPHHGRTRRCQHCTQRFELQFGCTLMMCTPSSPAWAAMGH